MLPYFSTPLSPTVHETLWHIVQRTFHFQANAWQPLWLNHVHLGYLNAKWRQQLIQDWQYSQQSNQHGLHLYTDTWQHMAHALQQLSQQWHELGLFHGWRNETFDVFHPHHRQALFTLERAAFRPLGLHSQAIHINGLQQNTQGWRFWIARRSPHKAVDPNKLDNLVSGGIASGESASYAMIREAWEEAGLPSALLQNIPCASQCTSLRHAARGLHHEHLYIYDIVLPDHIQPHNQDGEVAEFLLLTADELVAAMCQGQFMPDALLTTLDLFARIGLLNQHHLLYQYLHKNRK